MVLPCVCALFRNENDNRGKGSIVGVSLSVCSERGGYKCVVPCDVEEDVWVYAGCVGQDLCGIVREDLSTSTMHKCGGKHVST